MKWTGSPHSWHTHTHTHYDITWHHKVKLCCAALKNSSTSLLVFSGSHDIKMSSVPIADGHTSVMIAMTTALQSPSWTISIPTNLATKQKYYVRMKFIDIQLLHNNYFYTIS